MGVVLWVKLFFCFVLVCFILFCFVVCVVWGACVLLCWECCVALCVVCCGYFLWCSIPFCTLWLRYVARCELWCVHVVLCVTHYSVLFALVGCPLCFLKISVCYLLCCVLCCVLFLGYLSCISPLCQFNSSTFCCAISFFCLTNLSILVYLIVQEEVTIFFVFPPSHFPSSFFPLQKVSPDGKPTHSAHPGMASSLSSPSSFSPSFFPIILPLFRSFFFFYSSLFPR